MGGTVDNLKVKNEILLKSQETFEKVNLLSTYLKIILKVVECK